MKIKIINFIFLNFVRLWIKECMCRWTKSLTLPLKDFFDFQLIYGGLIF